MNIEGFKVGGQILKYDYNALANKPSNPGGGSGATAEQIAQIEQNKDDITELKGALDEVETIIGAFTENVTEWGEISYDDFKYGYVISTGAYYDNTGYMTFYFPVEENTTYLVTGTVNFGGVLALAVFYDVDSNCLGCYGKNTSPTDSVSYTDEEVTTPTGAKYMAVTKKIQVPALADPVVKAPVNAVALLNMSNFCVTLADEVISVKTNRNIEYTFARLSPNNLYQLSSWKLGNKTYSHTTDMIGPYHTLNAVNNADGDRGSSATYTNAPFTGGCHGYNGDQTGTPTANMESKIIILDGNHISKDGVYYGNDLCIKFVNLIQGNNTCKSDGTGRSILKEEVTYSLINNEIKVGVMLTPLEDLKLYRYYGMQLAGFTRYIMLADKYYDITNVGSKSQKPYMLYGVDGVDNRVEMVMDSVGLGDYRLNETDEKVISSSNKAYFHPIEANTEQWCTDDVQYWTGTYRFCFGLT